MGAIAVGIMAYVQPLIDETDGSFCRGTRKRDRSDIGKRDRSEGGSKRSYLETLT